MPGVFTTASQASRAARPPSAVTSTWWPSTGSEGRSSTRTGSAPRAASLRRLARPSRPRPQIPTRAPAKSDQESLGRLIGIPVWYEIPADGPQHGFGLGRRRRVRPARDLGGEPGQQTIARAVLAAGGQQHRGPALGDLADALERLGARAEQRPELAGHGRILERLAGHGEDLPQRLRRKERREDQVDESALVTVAAPVGESPGPFGIKGLVATAERGEVRSELCKLLPYPQLGAVPEPGEVLRALGGREDVAEGRFELLALGPLVVDRATLVLQGRDGRRPFVGHHHRVAVLEHRGQHGDGGQDAGDGDVTVAEAELGGAEELGVDLAFGPDDGEAGDRGGFLDRVEAVTRAADDEQGDVGALAHLLHGDDRVDPAAERDEGAHPGPGGN